MKQDPIKFRITCEPFSAQLNMSDDEFYVNEKEEWIYRKDVTLEPFDWARGFALRFQIVEYYQTKAFNRLERVKASYVCYDKDFPIYREDMEILNSGMINGRVAENLANKLFIYLFSTSEAMEAELPKSYKFYKDTLKEMQEAKRS